MQPKDFELLFIIAAFIIACVVIFKEDTKKNGLVTKTSIRTVGVVGVLSALLINSL